MYYIFPCFRPLKKEWEQILNLWVNKFGERHDIEERYLSIKFQKYTTTV